MEVPHELITLILDYRKRAMKIEKINKEITSIIAEISTSDTDSETDYEEYSGSYCVELDSEYESDDSEYNQCDLFKINHGFIFIPELSLSYTYKTRYSDKPIIDYLEDNEINSYVDLYAKGNERTRASMTRTFINKNYYFEYSFWVPNFKDRFRVIKKFFFTENTILLSLMENPIFERFYDKQFYQWRKHTREPVKFNTKCYNSL